VTTSDVHDILGVFAGTLGRSAPSVAQIADRGTAIAADSRQAYPAALRRRTPFLRHPVFNTHRSETQMMRYVRSLERKDIGLDTSMIPLGSCTMKLNAASEMLPVTWTHFSRLHPFVPVDQAAGYQQIFRSCKRRCAASPALPPCRCSRTRGLRANLPGSWSSGLPSDRGDSHRDVVLIPASAHGTNPPAASWPACGSWSSELRLTATSTSAIFGRRRPSTAIAFRA
jgi:glycine dehydrogenase